MGFRIYKEDGRIKFDIFGLKISFQNPLINRLEDCCSITNLAYYKKQGTKFPHPIGIVISKAVTIGKNCVIYQNVTVGNWKGKAPVIGDNVQIYSNSVIRGGVTIGNNVTIGAGSIVTKSIPDNAIVAGNPAKVIKIKEKKC